MLNYLRLTCVLTLGALSLAAQTASAPLLVTETTGMIAALKCASVTVLRGKSQAADLSGDTDLSIPAGQRREIRAQISIPGRTLVSLGHADQIPSAVAVSN